MKKSTSYSKEDVLKVLDDTAKAKLFPVLDNFNNYMASVRLTIYCSPNYWMFIFEIVGYGAPENEFVDHIYMIGNCLENHAKISEEIFVVETESDSIWDREKGEWLADWKKWQIVVRGKVYKFQPTLEEYEKAGIKITNKKGGLGSLRQDKLIRFLVFKLKDKLFCTDKELKKLLPQKSLTKFIRIEEWCHPDIRKNELPSQVLFFQKLAESLVIGVKAIPSDTLKNPNTHWSNWRVKWV